MKLASGLIGFYKTDTSLMESYGILTFILLFICMEIIRNSDPLHLALIEFLLCHQFERKLSLFIKLYSIKHSKCLSLTLIIWRVCKLVVVWVFCHRKLSSAEWLGFYAHSSHPFGATTPSTDDFPASG